MHNHAFPVPTPEQFAASRKELNDRLAESSSVARGLMALDDKAYAAGSLSSLQKELMGLAISVATNCDECTFYHLERCSAEGLTKDQLTEALDVALVGNGSVAIPLVRRAYAFAEQLTWA